MNLGVVKVSLDCRDDGTGATRVFVFFCVRSVFALGFASFLFEICHFFSLIVGSSSAQTFFILVIFITGGLF